MPRPASIPALRRQIDRIDDQLLRLLNRRARARARGRRRRRRARTRRSTRRGARRACSRGSRAANGGPLPGAARARDLPRDHLGVAGPRAAPARSPTSARRRPTRTSRRASSSAPPPSTCRRRPSPRCSTTSRAGAPTSASCRSRTRPRAWWRTRSTCWSSRRSRSAPRSRCRCGTACSRGRGTRARRRPARRRAPAGAGAVPALARRRTCPGVPTVEEASNARAARARTRRSAGVAAIAGRGRGRDVRARRPRARHPGRARQPDALPRPRRRHDASTPSGDDKTSLVFSVRDEVGVLARMLRPFAAHGIDLIKIESRPLRGRPWEYFFFLDLKGHRRERARGAGARRGRAARAAAEGPGLVPGGAGDPESLMDIRMLVPEWIRTLTPYPPGMPIEELERELGITGSIKLASNENPLGPSPRALAAVARALAHAPPLSRRLRLLPDAAASPSGTACRRTRSSSATARTRSSSSWCAPSSGRATRR